MEAAKEKVRLAQLVSDCDDEESLKKSRHDRKRKIIDTDEDSDGHSQESDKIKKNKSAFKLQMPSTISMSLNARSNIPKNKLVNANNANNGKSTLFFC